MPSMISIAAGSWHSLALTEDGLVLAWGAHAEVCVCVCLRVCVRACACVRACMCV
jgi:alpha-tubulin suppressor-like RCC1 family protein